MLCQVPISTRAELDQAAVIAEQAFEKWSQVAVPRRARVLFSFQQLLIQHKEELARLITLENGKIYPKHAVKSNVVLKMSSSRLERQH